MFKKVLAGVAGLVSFGLTYAEVIPGTTLSIDFQAGQVQAGGRTVHIYRIPVTDTNSGTTTFYDASFDFGVLSDGSIGFTRTSSAAVSSAPLTAGDNFIAGTYADSFGAIWTVSGPSVVAGGRYSYSAVSASGVSISWMTGPVASHPQIGSLSTKPADGAAGAFGVMGTNPDDSKATGVSTDTNWEPGYIIGATQQSSTSILLSRFHSGPNSYTSVKSSFVLTKK